MEYRNHSHLQDFIYYIKFEKRYSAHTVRAYHDDLNFFFQYLSDQYEEPPVEEITASMIKSWLAAMRASGLEPRTLNRKISVLRAFFKFLLKEGKIQTTPMAGVIRPKSGKALPVYVEEDQLKKLLEETEFPEDFEGFTHRLIVTIFYHTGMRLSELMNLKISQIGFNSGWIRVWGKGNKERVIPVSEALLQDVKEYMKAKDKEFKEVEYEKDYLLVTAAGKKLYSKYAYLVVKKYLGKVTTLDKKSPHVLRHSFATHLMRSGADLNAVKDLLGHASLAATQVYTHNNIKRLQEIHKKAHPRGGGKP